MASKKYNWKKIKSDYMTDKFKTLKELAAAHGVEYGYMRKRASDWGKEKQTIDFLEEIDTYEVNEHYTVPKDRSEAAINLYDDLYVIAKKMLSCPENFFTHEGIPKTKQFLDITTTVEKVAKGYADYVKDEAYTDMIKDLKANLTNTDSLIE